MKKFTGFTNQETFTQFPDSLFRDLLAGIDSAGELKVTLYAIWRIEHMEGRVRFLREKDFFQVLPAPLASLEKAVQRGTLLRTLPRVAGQGVIEEAEALYFLNTPRGRAAVKGFSQGAWSPGATISAPPPERPSIFKLYEENIGPLTPLLADALKDDEQLFSPEWIAEAIGEAVKNNKRNLKYVEAILRHWKEEGHAKEQDRRDTEGPRGRDVTRKVEDFLKR